MASRLTPIGWIAKFLVVPAALGALGFYVVGPRIGAVRSAPQLPTSLQDAVQGVKGMGAKDRGAPDVQEGPPPDVEVSTKPATSSGPNLGQDSDAAPSAGVQDESPKPRVRKRPASMVAPPTDPQPGEDDSGGQ